MTVHSNSEEELRQKVLTAALKSFGQSGYYKTQLSSIANRAGTTSRQIRRLFKSKRNILRLLFETERSRVRNQVDRLFGNIQTTDRAEVSDALKKLFYVIRDSEFLAMIYRFDDFPVWYCIDNIQNSEETLTGEMSHLEQFLKDCQQAGTLRSGSVPLIAHTYRSMIALVLNEPGMFRGSAETFEMLLDIFVDGLLCTSQK